MNFKPLIVAGIAAVMTIAPLSPAAAYGRGGYGYGHGGYDHGHHGHDPLLLPFIAVGAVLTGVALLATAPIRAVADAGDYSPGPGYAPPPQQVYAPPPQQVYYTNYPVYYAPPPPPRYYAPPPGYYYRRGY